MHDVFQRVRALLGLGSSSKEEAVSAADQAACQAKLMQAERRLAVADRRLAILEASNRTAVRAVRRFLQEREQRLAEREAADARLSLAVGDRQRTMMLNEQLIAALRDGEEARQRLEDEVRRLRRWQGETPLPVAPDGTADPIEG